MMATTQRQWQIKSSHFPYFENIIKGIEKRNERIDLATLIKCKKQNTNPKS